MGGCTLSAIRATREEAMEATKKLVISAVGRGLYPDSELVVYQKEDEEVQLYKVELVYGELGEEASVYDWRLQPVGSGRGWLGMVAAHYERAMKPGEWLATVHVHT